jgi:hypothetical protein
MQRQFIAQWHTSRGKEVATLWKAWSERPSEPGADTSAGKSVVTFRWASFLGSLILLGGVVCFLVADLSRGVGGSVRSLGALLSLPASTLSRIDIGRMNLLCGQGLPGADEIEMGACLRKLDEVAARVRSETERHRYRFEKTSAEFEHSEGFFRMLILAVVLAEDFGVRYAPEKIGTPSEARLGDGFFADARDVFLQGLLGPGHQGTRSSLPVLQVAVGRRLGYPLKLVTTKGHLFVRWEDAHERFNIEAAGNGVNRFTDDYYRHWPLEITPAEEAAEGYLKSLTPPEELAVFLSIRGMCLRESGKWSHAMVAFAAASRLAPGCRGYELMVGSLRASGGSLEKPRLQTEGAKATNKAQNL